MLKNTLRNIQSLKSMISDCYRRVQPEWSEDSGNTFEGYKVSLAFLALKDVSRA